MKFALSDSSHYQNPLRFRSPRSHTSSNNAAYRSVIRIVLLGWRAVLLSIFSTMGHAGTWGAVQQFSWTEDLPSPFFQISRNVLVVDAYGNGARIFGEGAQGIAVSSRISNSPWLAPIVLFRAKAAASVDEFHITMGGEGSLIAYWVESIPTTKGITAVQESYTWVAYGRMGSDSWSAPERLPGNNGKPRIALDRFGNAYGTGVISRGSPAGNFPTPKPFTFFRPIGGKWTLAAELPGLNAGQWDIENFAVSPSGESTVIFRDIYGDTFVATSKRGAPYNLPQSLGSIGPISALSVRDNGSAMVTFVGASYQGLNSLDRDASGHWGLKQVVPSTIGVISNIVSQSMDAQGNVIVAWNNWVSGSSRNKVWNTNVVTRTAAGVWQAPEILAKSTTPVDLATAAASDGSLFSVAWQGGLGGYVPRYLNIASRTLVTGWIQTPIISHPPWTNGSDPQLAIASDGRLTVTWRDNFYTVLGGTISYSVASFNGPLYPETLLDNAVLGAKDATGGRTFTGTWCTSGATGFYGSNSLYSCGTGVDTYRWTPTIATAGAYDVYVWWTSHANRSTTVPIGVTHATGTAIKIVNQQIGGGQWVLHGRYNFKAGASGYVEVKDLNGQASADAVKFVPAF
jgi:hypothetical protein